MTAATKRSRGGGAFVTFFAAGCLGILGWMAALAGTKGMMVLVAGLSFMAAMIVFEQRHDLILVVGVGASAALMHKTFTALEEVSSGPPSIYVNTFDIMVFVLWMAWFVRDPEKMVTDLLRAFRRPAMWLPIIAIVFMLPSIAVSQNATLTLAEVVRMSSMLMVFIYFAVAIRTKHQVALVILALMIVAVVEAALVAGQYLTTSTLGLSIFGTPSILHNRFDGIAVARPFGTMAHPVFMAAYVGPLALLAFSLAVNLRDRMLKWILIAIAGIAVTPLILASTRSASLALVIAFVALVVAMLVTGRLPAATAGWWALGLLTLAVLASPYLIDLWTANFQTEHFGVEVESRNELNIVAITMFEDRPFFGHGLNNFEHVLPEYDKFGFIFADNPVHNIYLLQLAESGIFGLTGLLIFGGGVTMVAARLARSRDRLLSGVGFAGVAIMLYWAVEEMLVFSLRQDHPRSLLFILAGLMIACDRMAGTSERSTRTQPPPRRTRSRRRAAVQSSERAHEPDQPMRQRVGASAVATVRRRSTQAGRQPGLPSARRAGATLAILGVLSLLSVVLPLMPEALAQETEEPAPTESPVPTSDTTTGTDTTGTNTTGTDTTGADTTGTNTTGTDTTRADTAGTNTTGTDTTRANTADSDTADSADLTGNTADPAEPPPSDQDAPAGNAVEVPRADVASEIPDIDFVPILKSDLNVIPPSQQTLAIVLTAVDRSDGVRRIYTVAPGSNEPIQVSPEDGRQYSWASWAFGGQKIVFTVRELGVPAGGPESIWMMNADGSGRELLLDLPYRSAQPKVSKDGRTLIWSGQITSTTGEATTGTRFYGWDLESGIAWNLSAAEGEKFLDSDPSFNFDGTKLVFIDSQAPGDGVSLAPGEVVMMDSSGQDRTPLTSNGFYDTDPAITNDLSTIVSSRYVGEGEPRSGTNQFEVKLYDFQIIERNVASGAETILSDGGACLRLLPIFSCSPDQAPGYLPLFTPDESQIGFMAVLSSRNTCICIIGRDRSNPSVLFMSEELALGWFDWVRPDSSVVIPEITRPATLPDQITKLFDFPVVEIEDVPLQTFPSEADLDIVFAAPTRDNPEQRLWLLEAGGTVPVQISPADGRRYDAPSFAFGGNKVVFTVSEGDGPAEIWWMNRNGTGVERLLAEEVDLRSPSISPDGTTLVFSAGGLIYGWDLATGFIFNASAEGASDIEVAPAFGSNSNEVVFASGSEIWTMDTTGQNRHQITANGRVDALPAMSSDNRATLSSRFLLESLPPPGVIAGFGIIHRVRDSGEELSLTSALGCHVVPTRHSCLPEQGSALYPHFTPDDQRAGYVSILNARSICICTVGVDGAGATVRYRSDDLVIGSWDWSSLSAIPATAILSPIQPTDQAPLTRFGVVDPATVSEDTMAGVQVVFTAVSRRDGASRIFRLDAGVDQPVQVSPEDGRTYRWASFARGSDKIVYTVADNDSSSQSIWWMNFDGTEPQRLLEVPGGVTHPNVSPDGTKLLFTMPTPGTPFTRVYRLDLTTGWVDNLSERSSSVGYLDQRASYNSDGTGIILINGGRVVLLDTNGRNRRTVTNSEQTHAFAALAGSGAHVASSQVLEDNDTNPFGLVVTTADSTDQLVLTRSDSCERVPDSYSCEPTQGAGQHPRWSHDDTHLGFVTTLSSTTMCLCLVDADGTNGRARFRSSDLVLGAFDWAVPDFEGEGFDPVDLETLPRDLLVTAVEDGESTVQQTRADRFLSYLVAIDADIEPADAAASADGNIIVFSAAVDEGSGLPILAPPPAGERRTHFTLDFRQAASADPPEDRADVRATQIFTVHADGSNLQQITTASTEDWRDAQVDGDARGNLLPDISPDGRYVVFTNVSTTSEESFILRLDLVTHEVLSLTNATHGALPAHDTDPKWSPDGRRVAFVADSLGTPEIWVMDANGENARPVSSGVEGRFPAWSADGTRLSFSADDRLVVLDLSSGQMSDFAVADNGSISRSAWSPDGQFLAYIALSDEGGADMHIRTVDGAEAASLETATIAELGIDW